MDVEYTHKYCSIWIEGGCSKGEDEWISFYLRLHTTIPDGQKHTHTNTHWLTPVESWDWPYKAVTLNERWSLFARLCVMKVRLPNICSMWDYLWDFDFTEVIFLFFLCFHVSDGHSWRHYVFILSVCFNVQFVGTLYLKKTSLEIFFKGQCHCDPFSKLLITRIFW